jgi:Flp pilus assembly protein TadG
MILKSRKLKRARKSSLQSSKRFRSKRFGAAAVEFAVCLPLIILIVAGSIEGASLLFLRQALIQSSYEGVKVAIKQDSVGSDVNNIALAVTDGRNLNGVTVETIPSDIQSVPQGDLIRVRVTAPTAGNSLFFNGVFTLPTVEAEAVMVKE